ncbi:MAG: hypothetical protein JWM10_5365, partial [Myxococcaceae bacterium]|nr:hypothetical protein [Myxococcaceae bacterium]
MRLAAQTRMAAGTPSTGNAARSAPDARRTGRARGEVPRAAGGGYDPRPMSTESPRFEIRSRRRAGVAAALLLAACQSTRGGPVPGGTGA